MQHIEKQVLFVLNKFSKNNLKQTKDYKTIYEYKDQKYILNTVDYIYLFQQTLINISKFNQQYTSMVDTIYLDILNNKEDENLYQNYSQTINLEIQENNYKITQETYKNNEFLVLHEKTFTNYFMKFVNNIISKLLYKNIKIYTLCCRVNYIFGLHSELIYFQIYENNLYIINYDPMGTRFDTSIMDTFMDYLSQMFNHFFSTNNMNYKVKTVYKQNLEFKYQGKKIGGIQRITKNLSTTIDKPSIGICEIYCYFILYCLIYILYSSPKNYLCSDLIKKIEYVLYFNFSQNSERFSNIIINFLNHTTDRYYEICLFHISEKDKFQKQIKYYFENMFADILLIKYLNKKYTEEGDIETLKSSGYNCKENSDCSSNHCVNNVCYIDEKEVNIDDIRSVGNPCLYNIQCRSGDCRDYVCIGEDNHEKEKNYDQVYDEDEIIEYEDNIEILDNDSLQNYLNM